MSKSNPKSTFRPIAPKPQEPIRDDVIAVVTLTPSEIQEITAPTTDTLTTVTTTKVSKKNNGQKPERSSLRKKQAGMIQIQDYC